MHANFKGDSERICVPTLSHHQMRDGPPTVRFLKGGFRRKLIVKLLTPFCPHRTRHSTQPMKPGEKAPIHASGLLDDSPGSIRVSGFHGFLLKLIRCRSTTRTGAGAVWWKASPAFVVEKFSTRPVVVRLDRVYRFGKSSPPDLSIGFPGPTTLPQNESIADHAPLVSEVRFSCFRGGLISRHSSQPVGRHPKSK